jgi:enoyl-[acyl-carrier protein] reductase II
VSSEPRSADAPSEAERLRGEVMAVLSQARTHEIVPIAGQTSGLIHEILPADIVRRLVAEAEQALQRAASLAK